MDPSCGLWSLAGFRAILIDHRVELKSDDRRELSSKQDDRWLVSVLRWARLYLTVSEGFPSRILQGTHTCQRQFVSHSFEFGDTIETTVQLLDVSTVEALTGLYEIHIMLDKLALLYRPFLACRLFKLCRASDQ